MTTELELLLEYCNDIALLLGVDDKDVVYALSDKFNSEEYYEMFEKALKMSI